MTLAVGFYGGSFDPPHRGHLAVARWALERGEIDRLLVAPVYEHPLSKRPGAPFEHRVAMCEIAFEGVAGVEVSEIERELGGRSRTLRALEALRARLPGAQLRLVIGADVLAEAHRWHRWDDVVALAPPLVAGRRGREGGDSPPLFDVSSTELREALSRGQRPEALVDPRVLAYIDRHSLYRGTP